MTGGRPLVSVVTPVWNGALYLQECLDSVVAQTYDALEILIVDNESTDDTLAIAREYAARDRRIRVLTPSGFLTADENANRALREISPAAAYVKIVHADDWITADCVERMVELGEAHPTVGIVSSLRLIGDRIDLHGLPEHRTVYPGREIGRSALLGRPYPYVFGSPTSLLLRADLVRARPVFYSLDNPHQSDQESCLDLLRESDFGFVHEVLTYTRRHEAAETPQFVRIGAECPCRLRLLTAYGLDYLSSREYRRKLAVRVGEYAYFLLRHLPRLLERDFRAYHWRELRDLRGGVSALDVVRGGMTLVRTGRNAPSMVQSMV